MPALEIRPDEIGSYDYEAAKARKARMMGPRPLVRIVVPPPATVIAPAPRPVKRRRAFHNRAYLSPTNARPDLAARIYRRPLKVGLVVACKANPGGSKLLPGKLSAIYDVTLFRPVRPHMSKVTANMLFRAMEPGCPPYCTAAMMAIRTNLATLAHARQIAMYCMVRGFGVSYAETGRRFGKDHTTVLYAVKKIAKLVKNGFLLDPLPYITGEAHSSLAAQ